MYVEGGWGVERSAGGNGARGVRQRYTCVCVCACVCVRACVDDVRGEREYSGSGRGRFDEGEVESEEFV